MLWNWTIYYNVNALVIGDVLYFASDDFTGSYGPELYKSDGTAAGTGIVKDIFPGTYGSYPNQFFNFNDKLQLFWPDLWVNQLTKIP